MSDDQSCLAFESFSKHTHDETVSHYSSDNILGKDGQVFSEGSWFHELLIVVNVVNVYVYNFIRSCMKMEEKGDESTLIAYNVFLNVYGKMSMYLTVASIFSNALNHKNKALEGDGNVIGSNQALG